ncbi:MAG: PD-(D/E)XK nuclease family protein [Verrucomicrobiota bacterium]
MILPTANNDNLIPAKGNKNKTAVSLEKFLSAAALLRENDPVQTHFLLGPAGSGKTFRCLAEIRAALRENPEGAPLILLAPKQATFQLERQILADPSVNGYVRLQILSFERLARYILKELKIAPPNFLSDEGRVMILRVLLMRHEAGLKLFSKSARRPGFAQQLNQLFNELQQHQFTPAKLRSLAQRPGLRRELQDKLHDLALLLAACSSWLAEHELQDGNLLPGFAEEGIRSEFKTQNSKLKIATLWLDGFAEMTPQELDLLAAILPFCERARLAFCLNESGAQVAESKNSRLSIWSAVGKTYQQCRQRVENLPDCRITIENLERDSKKNRFAENPVLRHLEKSWASPNQDSESGIRNPENAIQIVVCPDAEMEATFAAREILKFVRNGNRFRDCAILARNLDNFHTPLARVFRRYEIPFFLDRRESVAHHPLAELTRSALRAVAFDWPHDDWFAALKAGFSPVDETEIDRLENESLARGWRGKKWREPIQIADNPELEKFVARLRQRILPPFEHLAKRLARQKNRPNGEQLAEALRELWNDLKVEQRLQTWSDDSIHDSQSAIHSTVWKQMNLWLDNVALAFSSEALPLHEWLPILEAGLANLTVGVIPPVLDEVLIGSVDRARNPDLKLALVLGVNEAIFPATPPPPPILTEADREELNQQNAAPGPDLRERISREGYYGYIACTRASKKLVVSFSRHDADGKTLNPSPFIEHLQTIFPDLEIGSFNGEIGVAEIESASELIPTLVKIQDSKFRIQNWEELLKLPNLAKLTKNLGALREPGSTENLSPALAEKLYGPILRTSVSRLEEFAECPFRFFVRSGLRAGERKIFELDARERGSFQHDVLKRFHDDLMTEDKRWRDLTPPQARERVGAIAAKLMENYRDGLLHGSAQTKFTARALTESLQDFVEVIVLWLRGQNEFDPAAAELDFGGENSRAPAWEIDLGGGHKLALHGRIDRVDLWRDADGGALALVMDYKSSSKRLDAVLVEHGVQLQLLAYLNMLRHWKNPQNILGVKRLIPAGVFYVNLRGQFESGGSRDEILANADEARRKAYRHTGRFDADALEKLDRPGAADQFNYHRNKDGSLRKGSVEALPHMEFEALLDRVEMQLRESGRAIFSGEAKVDPYRKGRATPCEFCDYRAVCRIDPWTHHYRVLRVRTIQ